MSRIGQLLRSVPVTAFVWAATAVVSVVGISDHGVLHELERRAGELEDGEPWRLVSSLLVHDGWLALAANLVFLAIVGAALERRRSRVEWIVLYVTAGVVGQLAG